MKKNLLVFLLFALFISPVPIWAACTKTIDTAGFDTWETDGNESADVMECYNAAAAGDTINVIAGDGAADWGANAVTITADKPIQLIGPGADNLTINLTGDGSAYAITVAAYIGTPELPASRISGFKFLTPTDVRYCPIEMRGQGWRVDHNTYQFVVDTDINAWSFVAVDGTNTTIQPYGLIDHNTIINGKISIFGASNFANFGAAWAGATNLGTDEAVYIEDNAFTRSSNDVFGKLAVDTNLAGKYVFRYNALTDRYILVHGFQACATEAGCQRGPIKWEIYGNDINNSQSANNNAINILAGTGVIFYNDTTSATVYDETISLGHERKIGGGGVGIAGECDGESYFDGNEAGESGWLCRDQVGAGPDPEAWTNAANPGPAQASVPAYFWGNVKNSTLYLGNDDTTHIQAGRDYFINGESFDGTSGVGCGTLAARPGTCTTGVGYWATSQGNCSDLTGYIGVDATAISGTLYKCTSTDTWEAYYVPYTYPHPLQGVGGATYFDLDVTSPDNGTITSDDSFINCGTGGILCNYSYASTDLVELTFAPDPGFHLSATSGSCSGITNPQTIAMSEARTCTATFTANPAPISGGTISGGTISY